MKSLLFVLLLLSFSGCGKPNGRFSGADILNQIKARFTAPNIVLTPTDITSMFGPPDDTGSRTGGNTYYRYNVNDGGFVEIEFVNGVWTAAGIPSTY